MGWRIQWRGEIWDDLGSINCCFWLLAGFYCSYTSQSEDPFSFKNRVFDYVKALPVFLSLPARDAEPSCPSISVNICGLE